MANNQFTNTGKFLTVLVFIVFFSACSKNYFYQSEIEIPEGIWNSEKIAVFEPFINDTSQYYNVLLSFFNTDDYRYSNIWFFVKTISPDGFTHKDTVQYLMAEETGKWIGKRSGDSYKQVVYLNNLIRFPKQGKYTFVIQQGMRDIDLKGIRKVGILLEEINKN